jgi:hypothetical protein
MRIRRGFNRMFVLAWMLWILFAAGWSWLQTARNQTFWALRIQEGRYGSSWDPEYRATAAELAEWQRLHDAVGPMALLKRLPTAAGFKLVGYVVILVPGIVYVVLYAVGFAVGWVYRGFHGP